MPFYEFEGKKPSINSETFIHPEAVLIGDVEIDAGCYVGAGAVLRGDIGSIRIGEGSNVQENCVIHTFPDKSTILHPDTHIGHGCILHGCEICSNVLVGMGSVIADGVKINSNCLIGAGSFVSFLEEIPSNSVVVGSPAKVIKKISPEQLEQIVSGREIYQELAKRYLKSFREIYFFSRSKIDKKYSFLYMDSLY
ncbi:MAG: gamma carbonic anhydrase family protein [Desulfobacteraceae bacterium]|nr:gamma carbonic anhydrase family protein [Desulfobacteraceae bacterium]